MRGGRTSAASWLAECSQLIDDMSVHVLLQPTQRLQTLWPCLLHVQHQADEEVGKGRAARAGNDR